MYDVCHMEGISDNVETRDSESHRYCRFFVAALLKKACTQHVRPETKLQTARITAVTDLSQRKRNNVRRDGEFWAEGTTKLDSQISKIRKRA